MAEVSGGAGRGVSAKTRGFAGGRALIIAIANYDEVSPLPEAVLNDARDVARMLASDRCGYDPAQVEVLLDGDATLARIRDGLRDIATGVQAGETVIVYFSGHGGRMRHGAGSETLLLPFDCRPTDPAGTSLSAAEMSAALAAIPADRLLVVLDACHSGGAATLKADGRLAIGGPADDDLGRLAQGTGRVVMASSRSTETSIVLRGSRNSVFTASFLNALGGEAGGRGDGLIRVFDVFNAVAAGVRQAVPGRQHPVFKASDLEDNFPVALDDVPDAGPTTHVTAATESRRVEDVLAELYPLGPGDDEIWSRAGGDLARLDLKGSGRAQWHRCVRALRLGGGGPGISLAVLLGAALEDFPQHRELEALLDPS